MASREIDSFVRKFQQLWSAGFSAHLDLDSDAGEAWVGLRVKLGHGREQRDLPTFFHSKFDSPSRQRRRHKRAAERHTHENATKETGEVSDHIEAKIEVDKSIRNFSGDVTNDRKEIGSAECDDLPYDVENQNREEIEDIVAEKVTADTQVDVNTDNVSERTECKEADTDLHSDKKCEEVENSEGKNCEKGNVRVNENETNTNSDKLNVPASPITIVYALAKFENSNVSQISTIEASALSNILKSKDHLCRNIVNINFRNSQAYRTHSGKYEHSVQIEVSVDTRNLWESGRSYIYHHLGKDTWTLSDGTTISFVRIHQKR